MPPRPSIGRLLLILELPEPDPPSSPLLKALAGSPVTVLGWHPVSDQSSPEQTRERFEDEDAGRLDELAERLRQAGADDPRTRLVFTRDLADTVKRTLREEPCDAVLTCRPVEAIRRMILPLHGKGQALARLATVTARLRDACQARVDLLYDPDGSGAEVVDPAREALQDAGVPADAIHTLETEEQDPARALATLASDLEPDLVIVAESETTPHDLLFGQAHRRVADTAACPVLTVLRPSSDADEGRVGPSE